MIENTLGQFWWENHKAAMAEARDAARLRELEDAEQRRRNEDADDEAATLRVVKTRLGIRYYLMPWLIATEKRKLAKIATIENELNKKIIKPAKQPISG